MWRCKFGEVVRQEPDLLFLAVVVEDLSSERIEREMTKIREQLKCLPFSVDLRIYDFDTLKKKYGADEESA